MIRTLALATSALLILGMMQPIEQSDPPAQAEQTGNTAAEAPTAAAEPPATEPAEPDAEDAGRKPFQDDILKTLLRDQEAPQTIPQHNPVLGTLDPGIDDGDQQKLLLIDGTRLVERVGRVQQVEDKLRINIVRAGGERMVQLELLPNSLLELLEREVERGGSEFVVSGEVTRYRGRNYLLLRRVVRRVDNGNIMP